jgi:hypothetical protein
MPHAGSNGSSGIVAFTYTSEFSTSRLLVLLPSISDVVGHTILAVTNDRTKEEEQKMGLVLLLF